MNSTVEADHGVAAAAATVRHRLRLGGDAEVFSGGARRLCVLKLVGLSKKMALPIERKCFSSGSAAAPKAEWFGDKKSNLPPIVIVGEPILQSHTQEVMPNEIKSERVQKIIDDMIHTMRNAPGVGLAAP